MPKLNPNSKRRRQWGDHNHNNLYMAHYEKRCYNCNKLLGRNKSYRGNKLSIPHTVFCTTKCKDLYRNRVMLLDDLGYYQRLIL